MENYFSISLSRRKQLFIENGLDEPKFEECSLFLLREIRLLCVITTALLFHLIKGRYFALILPVLLLEFHTALSLCRFNRLKVLF